MAKYVRKGHYWKRVFRKFADQKGKVFCRLVDVNSASALRKWCREGKLYQLSGLYLLSTDRRATRHYLLRCMVDGQLYLRTDSNT